MAITVYQFPGLCSRVTMDALEQIGLEFEDRAVNAWENEQNTPEYLSMNPKGKIPTVDWHGTILTENAAIIWFLHQLHPDAGLLPVHIDGAINLRGLSDLVWCSSTMHPAVRHVRRPDKLTVGDTTDVHTDGLAKFAKEAKAIAERIGDLWWYGDDWSIIDTYLYWCYSTAQLGGFPLEDYPALVNHANRVRARPAFQRVIAREQAVLDRLGITTIKV